MTFGTCGKLTNGSDRSKTLFLTYHEVCLAESPYAYSIDWDTFRRHALFVKSASTDIGSDIHITFDDGYLSSFTRALPVLQASQLTATFFVVVGWVSQRPNYMTWNQLRELCALGHRVQSHTWSHAFLSACSDSRLQEEVASSKHELEARLGMPIDSLSAPGGRWNHRSVDACVRAGYTRLFISQPWVHRFDSTISILGRLMVRRSMTAAYLRRLAMNDPILLLKMRGRAVACNTVRRAIGDALYLQLWRTVMRKPSQEQNGPHPDWRDDCDNPSHSELQRGGRYPR